MRWRFWKKKRKIDFLNESRELLEYLYKNSAYKNKRKKENIIKKFGKEKYERLYSFLGGKEISLWREEKDGEKFDSVYLRDEGLKILRDEIRENKRLLYSKLMFISSLILVAVTISYVILTGINIKIIQSQFEAENLPYLTIKELSWLKPEFGLPGYSITLENLGNYAVKIISIKLLSSPRLDAKTKISEESNWIFPGEEIKRNFGKSLNLYGGFDFPKNASNFVRVEVKYLWNNKEYYTIRDFSSPDPNLPSPVGGDTGTRYDKGGQIFNENPPNTSMYEIYGIPFP